MFDLVSGAVTYRLPEHGAGVVAVLPDGDRLLFHGNGTPLRAWSLTHGELRDTRWTTGNSALGAGTVITSGYELEHMWTARTWTRQQTIPTGHRGPVERHRGVLRPRARRHRFG